MCHGGSQADEDRGNHHQPEPRRDGTQQQGAGDGSKQAHHEGAPLDHIPERHKCDDADRIADLCGDGDQACTVLGDVQTAADFEQKWLVVVNIRHAHAAGQA